MISWKSIEAPYQNLYLLTPLEYGSKLLNNQDPSMVKGIVLKQNLKSLLKYVKIKKIKEIRKHIPKQHKNKL